MHIDLRHLRHLRVLAELGHFGRAAEALHITQSALSRSIQSLEATVGAALVVRQRGGIEPTDLGQLVLRHAHAMDAASRDLERDIRLAQGLELGELRVGAGPFGGAALIGPVIGRLNRRHPGLDIRLVITPWHELPRRARAREVDVVVLEISEVEALEDFETLALSAHRLELVARQGHPITRLAAPTADDVLRYPLVGPSLPLRAQQRLGLLSPRMQAGRQGPAREGPLSVECDSSSVLKSILAESDAVSLMPRFMIERELLAGLLTHLPAIDLGLGARFGAAWLRQRSLSRAGQTFLEHLQAHDAALARQAREVRPARSKRAPTPSAGARGRPATGTLGPLARRSRR